MSGTVASMTTSEYTFTEFLRSPREVAEAADRSPRLIIHRRNAPDLVLSRADRRRGEAVGAAGAAALLSQLLAHDSLQAGALIVEALPWTRCLSEKGRSEFALEFAEILAVSAELDSFAPLAQMLDEWKATAALQADPELADELARPIPEPDGRPVPAP